MNTNLVFMSVIMTLIPCISVATPANYDECILENISNAQTNAGVGAVRRACRSLFPAPTNEPEFVPIPLPSERTKFQLTRVSVERSGSNLVAELINDTQYFLGNITYRYKTVDDCATPTRAAVVLAQKTLNDKGFNAGAVDGRLGAGTRSAIVNFQEARSSLEVTGKLDDPTLAALDINEEIGWKSAYATYNILLYAPRESHEFNFNIDYQGAVCGHFIGWANVPIKG